jgi:hypothetical protein
MILHDDAHKQVTPSDNPTLQGPLKVMAESQDTDHIEICFPEDGSAQFYPRTNNPQRLHQQMRWLLRVLRHYPESVRCAAGACQGGHIYDAR